MRTKIRGLNQPNERKTLLEGPYLARVVRFEPGGHAAKPCRVVTFLVLDPGPYSSRYVRTRLYCHERALWKLRWFLRDFGYDHDLMATEELDDRQVVGLEGVIRLAFWGTDGQRRLDVQGFAPKEEWAELSERMGAGRPAGVQAEA
jgi:hypothetical protein